MVFVNFHKIDVFKKSTKKIQIWAPFWDAKPIKNQQKIVFEIDGFFNTVFLAFCEIFSDFGSILGGPGRSKNWKNR